MVATSGFRKCPHGWLGLDGSLNLCTCIVNSLDSRGYFQRVGLCCGVESSDEQNGRLTQPYEAQTRHVTSSH